MTTVSAISGRWSEAGCQWGERTRRLRRALDRAPPKRLTRFLSALVAQGDRDRWRTRTKVIVQELSLGAMVRRAVVEASGQVKTLQATSVTEATERLVC